MVQRQTSSISLFVVVVLSYVITMLGFAALASAQDKPAVEVTPIYSFGTYTRTFVYPDKRAGYIDSGAKSDLNHKGVEVRFNSTGAFAVSMQMTGAGLQNPNWFWKMTDGRYNSEPATTYSSNSTNEFGGDERNFAVVGEYRRGVVTYFAGFTYVMHLDKQKTQIFGEPGPDYATFDETYFAPKFGARLNPKVGRFGADLSASVSPWVAYRETYTFQYTNSYYGDQTSVQHDKETSRSYEVRLGGSVDIVKNRLAIAGGFHRTELRSPDFLLKIMPSDTKTPQHDVWQGVYIGLRYSR